MHPEYNKFLRAYSCYHSHASGESWRLSTIHKAIAYSNDHHVDVKELAPGSVWMALPVNKHELRTLRASVATDNNVREALRLVGGGAWSLAQEAESYVRLRGGWGNVLRSLAQYVTPKSTDLTLLWSLPPPRQIALKLFAFRTGEKLTYLRPREFIRHYRLPSDSSAGAIANAAYNGAVPRKLPLVYAHLGEFDLILQHFQSRALPSDEIPVLPWRCASRGKMVRLSELDNKIEQGKSLSRMVSVSEPLEHYLTYPMYLPIMRHLRASRAEGRDLSIQVGIRKNSPDWPRLRESLRGFKYVMTSDWSGFDASVPALLLDYALRVLRASFDHEPRYARMYARNYANFYAANFIQSSYITGPVLVRAARGVPSGSILTSIIGSIVNYTVLDYLMRQNGHVTDYKILVYGDDAFVGFNAVSDVTTRSGRRGFLSWMRGRARDMFGMELSESATEISTFDEMCYTMVQPRYDYEKQRLLKGTRGLVSTSHRPTDAWHFRVDYDNGYTHRGQYQTAKALHFLKKGWDELGRPITTTFETILKLVNPENTSRSIRESMERVLSAAADNVHNKFALNQCGYIYMALRAMKDTLGWGEDRWPLIFSQRIYRSIADPTRWRKFTHDLLATDAQGRIGLRFRVERGYENLLSCEPWGRYMRDYEEALLMRTGWRDVQMDWERMAGRGDDLGTLYHTLAMPKVLLATGKGLASTTEAPRKRMATAMIEHNARENLGLELKTWGRECVGYHVLRKLKGLLAGSLGALEGPYLSWVLGKSGHDYGWEGEGLEELADLLEPILPEIDWCDGVDKDGEAIIRRKVTVKPRYIMGESRSRVARSWNVRLVSSDAGFPDDRCLPAVEGLIASWTRMLNGLTIKTGGSWLNAIPRAARMGLAENLSQAIAGVVASTDNRRCDGCNHSVACIARRLSKLSFHPLFLIDADKRKSDEWRLASITTYVAYLKIWRMVGVFGGMSSTCDLGSSGKRAASEGSLVMVEDNYKHKKRKENV